MVAFMFRVKATFLTGRYNLPPHVLIPDSGESDYESCQWVTAICKPVFATWNGPAN